MPQKPGAHQRRRRHRARKRDAAQNINNIVPGRVPVGFVPAGSERAPTNPCDPQFLSATHQHSQTTASGAGLRDKISANSLPEASRSAATPGPGAGPYSAATPSVGYPHGPPAARPAQSVGNFANPPPQSIPTGPRNQRRPSRYRGFGMKGFGPSFGSRARAAELNAATAAKARENECGAQAPDPSFTQRVPFNPPGPVGAPDNAASRGWKPLNAESPQYNPNVLVDNRAPMNRPNARSNSRTLSASTNTPRAVHPLRNVTTLDAGHGNNPFNTAAPQYGSVAGMPQVMGNQQVVNELGHPAYGSAGPGGLSLDQMRLLSLYGPESEPPGPRAMGPDDLSPTKQEEKDMERRRLPHNAPQQQSYSADPFVSSSSDRPTNQDQQPYRINPPPGPGNLEHSQNRQQARSEHSQVPNFYSNAPPDTQANLTSNTPEHTHSSMYRTGPYPAMPGPNEPRNKTPGPKEGEIRRRQTQTRQETQTTPVSTSVNSAQTTPARQQTVGSSGRPTVGNSAQSQKGKEPVYASVQSGSPEAYRAPHTSGGPGPYMQPQASDLMNPLLQSNQPSAVQQPPLLNANSMYPPGNQFAGHGRHDRNKDAFSHLDYHQRPVPWAVTPAEKGAPRQSMSNPPPGLPVPDPHQDDVMLPSQDSAGALESSSVAPVDPDREGEEQLRIRIGEIACEEEARRLQSGSSQFEARRAHDMTSTLGNALVNLQSYVVGDPRKQAANFARFGGIPDYAIEKNQDGHRSYFDNDPRADVWRLPPPREFSNPQAEESDNKQEGEGSNNV